MQLSSLLLMGLSLTSTASGYVITLYSGSDCSGYSQRRNVYDNSCAGRKDNMNARSARVEVYGGGNQKARFHSDRSDGACGLETVFAGPWDASRANYSWKKGNCIDFKGKVAYAFGSFAV